MPRVVRDAEDREWIVTSEVHLSEAAVRLGKVDPADGILRASALGLSVALAVAVLFSVPGQFWAPTVIYGPLLLALGIFLLWWAWRRPWSVTVAASDGRTEPEVQWVHGPWEALQTSQNLAEDHTGTPERSRQGQLGAADDWFEGDWDDTDWDGPDRDGAGEDDRSDDYGNDDSSDDYSNDDSSDDYSSDDSSDDAGTGDDEPRGPDRDRRNGPDYGRPDPGRAR